MINTIAMSGSEIEHGVLFQLNDRGPIKLSCYSLAKAPHKFVRIGHPHHAGSIGIDRTGIGFDRVVDDRCHLHFTHSTLEIFAAEPAVVTLVQHVVRAQTLLDSCLHVQFVCGLKLHCALRC